MSDAVILLHGFPELPSAWDPVRPALDDAGYRVLAPLQRGYDPANRPRGRGAYRTSALADDVLRLADREGIDRFHLVGHDWGGVLAWWLAARSPERLLTMTSMATPHPRALRAVALRSTQLLRSYYVALFQVPGVPERVALARNGASLRRTLTGSGLSAARADEFVDALSEPGALTAAINWYRGTRMGELLTLPVVDRVPVLYVWGAQDFALGREAAEATARFVTAPYRFVPLDGASHWLPEEHADLVVPPLLEHLSAG